MANRQLSTDLVKSNAVLDGIDDAKRDLTKCVTAADVAWYRRVVHENLADGDFVSHWYAVGYDSEMAGWA